MCNAERLAITMLIALGCGLAQAAPPSAPAGAPAAAERATIGEITELARQLKVEQLKKELRSAQKSDAGLGASGAMPALPPAFAASAGPTPVSPKPKAEAPKTPSAAEVPLPAIAAIVGAGGKLRARTRGGSELEVGARLYSASAQATVTSIEPRLVVFEVCERVPAAKGQPPVVTDRCETRKAAVSPT